MHIHIADVPGSIHARKGFVHLFVLVALAGPLAVVAMQIRHSATVEVSAPSDALHTAAVYAAEPLVYIGEIALPLEAIPPELREEVIVSVVDEPAQIPTVPPVPPNTQKASHAVGVFLTASSASRPDFFAGTMKDLQEAGGNALVMNVKGSVVYFDADTPMAKELGLVQKQYDLADILSKAHERGIYVIGRFIAVKDAGFTKKRPDTLIAHPTSGMKIGYEYIDPENADALTYNRQILCALAKAGIDEINLDYIRFSTEQFGSLGVYSMEEKSRKVGVFVKMAREAIDTCGASTQLGISTYAILGWDYAINLANLGQDIVTLAQYVDIISPMAYPATFAENAYYIPGKSKGTRMYFLVWRTLEGYKELLGENAWKLRPWIQGYGVTFQNMRDEMQAVKDAGLCGFTVWNANNAYGVTYRAMEGWEGCGE